LAEVTTEITLHRNVYNESHNKVRVPKCYVIYTQSVTAKASVTDTDKQTHIQP